MASSSSSQQQNDAFSRIEHPGNRRKVSESSRLFDVFINHRGPDVKQTLARQLYNSLQELGIRAFLDSEEKELGDSFPSTIETAIRSASVHIAIFSKRYAESAWCLEELVLMLQSQAKIIPVFYNVKPSELRYIENGVYAKAFTHYKEKSRHLEKLKKWKEALQTVSYIAGWEVEGSNSDVCECKDIVTAVQKEVARTKSLHVAKYPVGLHNLVQDFEKQCLRELVKDFESQCGLNEGGKEKAKAVGIFGMGGSGKTTLSKELFNRKRVQYTRACFLFDVREASAKGELPSLQIKLMKALFNEDPPIFQSIEEGTSYIKDLLERSSFLSFLIILDDIDHVEQLDALLVRDILNKSTNTLVIVTTRDVGVLISSRITIGYNLKGMNRNDARELFCWHAFDQSHPGSGYEDIVDDFVTVCGGLPLSLQVLGRHVCGRDRAYWCLELHKARKTLPGDVKKRLRISFDALDSVEKQMFMDVACFFIHEPTHMALEIWKACGWSAEHALQTLKDKCLVEEFRGGVYLRMHDHLRDLGREMAGEMGTPRRLWRLQELNGFQTTLAQTNVRCFKSIQDRTMHAKITYFIGNSEDWSETSASLVWLELEYFSKRIHMTSIPSWIPLKNLQHLRITKGRLKRLWQSDVQVPSSLKELHIAGTILEELPDLSGMSSHLKKVCFKAKGMTIDGWSLLEFLIIKPIILVVGPYTLSFERASNNRGLLPTFMSSPVILTKFRLRGILALNNREQPPTVKFPMSSLEKLEIKGQNLVTKILISGHHYPNLKTLHLVSMKNLNEVDLNMVTTLSSLHLNDCEHLKSVLGMCRLTNLVELTIQGCPQLEELPCLFRLSCLKSVSICDCLNLNGLQLDGCNNLRTVKLFNVPKLAIFSIRHCLQLEELGHFIGRSFLERITIDGCGKVNCLELRYCKNLKTLSGNVNVARLRISNCRKLEELSSLVGVEDLLIVRCEKLQNITLPTTLTYLEVEGIELKTVPGISDLTNLESLIISNCLELEELSVVGLSFLKRIKIRSCEKLQNIAGIEELPALKDMQLSLCSNAVIRNYIHRLQRFPSKVLTVIGSAVDGAKSILSPHLFSDRIGAEAVIQIDGLLSAIQDEDEDGSVSAIIICGIEDGSVELDIEQRIFTKVITDDVLIGFSVKYPRFQIPLEIKKAHMVIVKKGEEWKILNVMKIICDHLLKD